MGNLYSYAGRCDVMIEELKQSLSTEEIETLRAKMSGDYKVAFQQWLTAIRPQIESWIALTPSQRKKKNIDPKFRAVLTVGAIQRLLVARQLLYLIEEYGLHPGMTYRDMAVAASRAASSLSMFEKAEDCDIGHIVLDM